MPRNRPPVWKAPITVEVTHDPMNLYMWEGAARGTTTIGGETVDFQVGHNIAGGPVLLIGKAGFFHIDLHSLVPAVLGALEDSVGARSFSEWVREQKALANAAQKGEADGE